jgi:signal peptidase II
MKKIRILQYLLIFIAAVFIDRITKIWAIKNFMYSDTNVFPGLNLTLVWNRGVACGFFNFRSWIGFAFVAAVVFSVMCLFAAHSYYLFKKGRLIYFEVLILAGAISNFADRFLYKGVADFVQIYCSTWYFPIFNFADLCVVFGVMGILIRYVIYVYFGKNQGI